MAKQVRQIMAPCGLDCGKCLANPDSRIAVLARELREELGGFASYAEHFARMNPAFAQYPDFAALLDHLADGGTCTGCRSGRCLFARCEVGRCTRERGVDYCSECDQFPCAKANLPAHLDALWRSTTAAIRKMGPDAFFKTIRNRPRYPAVNKPD